MDRLRLGVLVLAVALVATASDADARRRPRRDPAKPKAAQHVEAGQVAFDLGEYGSAIKEWQAAYQIGKDPKVLFLLGEAFRSQNDCSEALRHYQSYLTLDPKGARRPQAETHVENLQKRCPQGGQAPPPPPVEPPPPPPPPEPVPVPAPVPVPEPEPPAPVEQAHRSGGGGGLKVAGFVLGVSGVALAVTGGYFALQAKDKSDDVTFACRTFCDWQELKDLEDQGKRNQTLGMVLLAGGGVALVSGVVLYAIGAGKSRTDRVAIDATPRGMSVVWAGRF